MWVRGVIRRRDAGRALDRGQLFWRSGGLINSAGLRLCDDGGDLAWMSPDAADAMLQQPATVQRNIGGSVLLRADQLQREIDRLAELNLELLSDPEIGPADAWTPYAQGGGLFGTRADALRLIGAARPNPVWGRGVNVAILDYGIEDAWLRREQVRRGVAPSGVAAPGVFRGWPRFHKARGGPRTWILPGDKPPGELTHGQMIARNVLAIAPAATIWDVPLLPDTVLGPPSIAMAEAIFWHMLKDLRAGKRLGRGAMDADGNELPDMDLPTEQPWILVNAWGSLDPIRNDPHYRPGQEKKFEPYWNNGQHFFVEDMPRLSDSKVDVVFAAGNCGTPGAHPLCGDSMSGPGRSIHGVNAHSAVLTVGAVRVDGVPVGGSAQGPGALWRRGDDAEPDPAQDSFRDKPDLCAPSQFHETDGETLLNTGTSAACGIAAGVLAALRSEEHGPRRTPAQMRALLRQTTAGPGSDTHDPRLGWGVVNLQSAMAKL